MANILTHWNGFVQRKRAAPLGTGELALYYVLMEHWNGLGRPEWLSVAAGVLQADSGLSDTTFKRARQRLCRKGYVNYRQGAGRSAARYHLVDLSCGVLSESKQVATQRETSAGAPGADGKVAHKLDRKVAPLSKDKEKEKEDQHPLAGMLETVEWRNYAQMRLKMKKPLEPRAVCMALDKLLALAPDDEGLQRRILDQSTFYCWKDLYPLERRTAQDGAGAARAGQAAQERMAGVDINELARRSAEERAACGRGWLAEQTGEYGAALRPRVALSRSGKTPEPTHGERDQREREPM